MLKWRYSKHTFECLRKLGDGKRQLQCTHPHNRVAQSSCSNQNARKQRKQGRVPKSKGKGRASDWASKRRDAENYVARSAFKLAELDDTHSLLSRNGHVLDLGCAPGAWLQVASERRKQSSRAVLLGVDVQPLDIGSVPGVDPDVCYFLQADVEELNVDRIVGATNGSAHRFDCVLSDLAPSTTGVKDADAGRSYELAQIASEIALSVLRKNGNMCVKLLEGPSPGIKTLEQFVKPYFQKVKFARPKATRDSSSEVYVIGRSFVGD